MNGFTRILLLWLHSLHIFEVIARLVMTSNVALSSPFYFPVSHHTLPHPAQLPPSLDKLLYLNCCDEAHQATRPQTKDSGEDCEVNSM